MKKGINLKKCILLFLLVAVNCCLSYAQTVTVTGHLLVKGKVTDKVTGDPLDGVSVGIKSSNTGTTTNSKGEFSLQVPSRASVLVFSHIGKIRQEIPVGDGSNFSVSLVSDNSTLDDVIVVGYGTQKKIHLTGAVESVDMKQIQDLPVQSLSAALRGQMPGVSVSGGYSRPGNPATITIRNPIFLSKDGGKTTPLFVIDNIIRSQADFNVLDPLEIENISILKDAAAAIYGIQGSNGVIVVKTKRGKTGAPRINYSTTFGITDAVSRAKMMSGYEHAVYLNDMNIAGGKDTSDVLIYSPDELEHFKNNNYDWLDMAWQKAFQMRHAINVSGGSDRATYFAGFSYNTQNGNFDGINNNKYTFRASTDIKVATGLKLALSLSGSLSDNKQVFSKQGGENLDNDWKTLTVTPRFNPPYVNGLPVQLTSSTNSTIDNYHFFAIQNSDNFTQSKNTGLNFQGQLNYDFPFLKGLSAGVNFNKNISNDFGKQYGTFYNVYSFAMDGWHNHIFGGDVLKTIKLNNGDRVRLNPAMTDYYQLNATLQYDRQFGKHQIALLGVYEQSETETDGISGMVEGIIVGGLPNTRYGTGTNTATETQSEIGRLAYLGRLDYNYASKYLLQFTLRADASTSFAPENRWGYFPSLSLGWVISEERFFRKSLGVVNFLKLRGSVGLLGTDNTKAYQWLQSYKIETGKAPVFGGNNDRGLAVTSDVSMPNRNVKWDKDDKFNVGIDAKFLNSRLSFSADGFYDRRSNQLANLTSSVSLLVGAITPSENYGKSNSFGYEISTGWKDNIGKDWSYNINSFLSWSDNEVLIGDFPVGDIGTYLDPTGKSTDRGFFGYRYLGIFRTQQQLDEFIATRPNYKLWGAAPKVGMPYYEDIRGPKDASGKFSAPDGKVDEEDQDYLTSKSDNHYSLGFNWGVTYKTVSLNVVMGMSFGGQAAVESNARSQATITANRPAFWADHWTPQHIDAKYPSPYYKDIYNKSSDFWFRSSTTLRVSNLNLSYTLPQQWVRKARMSGAKLFLIATNPFNLYNPYDYKDNSSAYDVYPVLKSYSLGLNLNL